MAEKSKSKSRAIAAPPDHLEPAERTHWVEMARDIPHDRLKTRAQLYLLELASRHAASIDFLSRSIVEMEKIKDITKDEVHWKRYREAVQTRSQESKSLTAALTQLMTSNRWTSQPIRQSKWDE